MIRPVNIVSFVLLFVLAAFPVARAEDVIVTGKVFGKEPAGRVFARMPGTFSVKDFSGIISVPPDSLFPLATDSMIILGSHTITLYPGAMVKILSGTFQPVLGRIAITNENLKSDPLVFCGERFSGQFHTGRLLIEITPEKTAWFAMEKKGTAWIKDFERRIVEFQPGTELEVPPFSPGKTNERLSSRWSNPPAVSVIRNVNAVFSNKVLKNSDDATADDGKNEFAADAAVDTEKDKDQEAAANEDVERETNADPASATPDMVENHQ